MRILTRKNNCQVLLGLTAEEELNIERSCDTAIRGNRWTVHTTHLFDRSVKHSSI